MARRRLEFTHGQHRGRSLRSMTALFTFHGLLTGTDFFCLCFFSAIFVTLCFFLLRALDKAAGHQFLRARECIVSCYTVRRRRS